MSEEVTYVLTDEFKQWRDETLERQTFITEWAEALKTSKQALISLVEYDDKGTFLGRCCLGEACRISGVTDEQMVRCALPQEVSTPDDNSRLKLLGELSSIAVAQAPEEASRKRGFVTLNDALMTHAEISTLLTEGQVTAIPHRGKLETTDD